MDKQTQNQKKIVIGFCRRKTGKGSNNITKCECMDFVEATHRNQVYPLLYCRMETMGNLDTARLKNAIHLSSKIVPEVLYSYNFRRGCFVNQGFTADHTVIIKQYDLVEALRWDLSQCPQLRITIYREERKDTVLIGISHILTDGNGFLQYLYLLASLYNGKSPAVHLQNKREIAPLLKNIHVQPPTVQTRRGRYTAVPPLRPVSNGKNYFWLNCSITSDDLTALQAKAKKCGVSLNDVFMTAYVRVIARLQHINKVVIPCPADLRRFQSEPDHLTIANMRLYFKNIDVVSCSLAGTFRLPPYFQLTISTFRDVCTFNCTLAGSAGDEIIGQQILEQVKSELLAWLTE